MARQDDPSITNGDTLWRRILPGWITPNGAGGWRVSSAAFKDNTPGNAHEVSVHEAKKTNEYRALADFSNDSLASITAGVPRSLRHTVASDPAIEDDSHAVIWPPDVASISDRNRDAKSMAKQTQWVVLKQPVTT